MIEDSSEYRRVSSKEQEDETGYARQANANNSCATSKGFTITFSRQEDIPGWTTLDQRPALLEVVDHALMTNSKVIHLENHTRFARETAVALPIQRELQSMGLRILWSNGEFAPKKGDDPGKIAVDQMQHVFAEMERNSIVLRLEKGRDIKEQEYPGHRAQGGALPFGYRRTTKEQDGVKGLIAVDPIQGAIVTRIFALRGLGWPIGRIAREIDLHVNVVWNILRRELYMQGAPWRIIDPRVWHAVQSIDGRHRNVKVRNTSSTQDDSVN